MYPRAMDNKDKWKIPNPIEPLYKNTLFLKISSSYLEKW